MDPEFIVEDLYYRWHLFAGTQIQFEIEATTPYIPVPSNVEIRNSKIELIAHLNISDYMQFDIFYL